jgi:drug/metabolite transporter (DMT)-like permease
VQSGGIFHRKSIAWIGDNAGMGFPGIGELCSILSALAWAVGIMLYRQLGASLPPLRLNFLKNLLVFALLLPAIVLVHGARLPDFTALELAAAVGSGVLGIGIADTLYFRALNALGAGRMGAIGNLYSPMVIVLSFAFLGERLRPLQLLGFALVSVGVWVAAWPRKLADDAASRSPPTHALRGFGFALLAIVLMACSIVLVKRVLEAQPLFWVTGLRMAGALAAMLAIAAVRGEIRQMAPRAASVPWLKLGLAAFVGQFLAMVLWLAGYKFTLASVAAVLNETASIFILLLAWAWLKEPLTRRAVFGVVLTFSGVCFMLWVR